MKKINIKTILLVTFFCSLSFSQDDIPPAPIEWGEVSKNDLEMSVFQPDTNAAAVILCDYGETKPNDNFELVFKRHLRVKIINPKGFNWGTHSVTLNEDPEYGDKIDDIEGITYTLSSNGKVIETEFDDDDVFVEKLEKDRVRHKFTLPGLQPGCIIEIRYKIRSKSLFGVRDWTFQHSEPVLWSEYRLIHPTPISFAVVTRGFEKFAFDSRTEVRVAYSGDVASYYGGNIVSCYLWRWAMKDISALREEPYITTLDDYYSKVDIQLAAYAMRGGGIQRVLNSWENFVKELHEAKEIGRMTEVTGDIEETAQKIIGTISHPAEKMKAIYNWVSSSIVWTGAQTIWAEQELDDILTSKKGNSADINYLLVALLRAAGIQSDPLILSTRDNGLVQDMYPIARQFNYGIARAIIFNKSFYLDATNPSRPMELLPAKILGVRALAIKPKSVEWVVLSSPVKSVSLTHADISVAEDGSLTGKITGTYKDYANINVRNSLAKGKEQTVIKDLFSLDASGLTLDSTEVVFRDSIFKPIVAKSWVSSQHYGQANDDFLYINPHIVERLTDNPFKSQVRKFPIDYNYPREYTTVVNIVIPDTFEVKETIGNKKFAVHNDIVYTRQTTVEGQRLQLISKLDILSREISSANYEKLKNFYASVIQAESEQIVLKRKPAPVIAPIVVPPPIPEEKKSALPEKKKKK